MALLSSVAHRFKSILPYGNSEEVPAAEAFVAWPNGSKGQRLQDLAVEVNADQLFDLLFGPNSPVGTICRERQGVKDYVETAWMPSEAALKSALHLSFSETPQPKALEASVSELHRKSLTDFQSRLSHRESLVIHDVRGAQLKGRCRMNTSHGQMLGRVNSNFERERILDAKDGGPYTIEVCVRSTAMMGERFRCVFLHRIIPLSNTSSRWTADFAIVYVEKTNVFLRKTIESGAVGAIRKNFAMMGEILKQQTALGDSV